MSRQLIAKLENEIDLVLRKYETEYEMTLAEIVGVLSNLASIRQQKNMLPFLKDELENLLEVPVLSKAGAPEGEIIHMEGKDSMET